MAQTSGMASPWLAFRRFDWESALGVVSVFGRPVAMRAFLAGPSVVWAAQAIDERLLVQQV